MTGHKNDIRDELKFWALVLAAVLAAALGIYLGTPGGCGSAPWVS